MTTGIQLAGGEPAEVDSVEVWGESGLVYNYVFVTWTLEELQITKQAQRAYTFMNLSLTFSFFLSGWPAAGLRLGSHP